MFTQIEPHPAGFSQGIYVGDAARSFYASTYVWHSEDGTSDFEAAFDRLEAALSAKGFSLSDIVSMTTMLRELEDSGRFRQARVRRLGGCLPASTLIAVEAFDAPEKSATIEIIVASRR